MLTKHSRFENSCRGNLKFGHPSCRLVLSLKLRYVSLTELREWPLSGRQNKMLVLKITQRFIIGQWWDTQAQTIGGAMRSLLMLLLALVSSNAVAEWVKVGEIEETSFYYKPSSIHKEGDKVKMWALIDYKTAKQTMDGKSYFSDKSQEEYDCKKILRRTLNLSTYSKNMSKGDIIFSYTLVGNWVHIPPDSIVQDLWNIACGKK